MEWGKINLETENYHEGHEDKMPHKERPNVQSGTQEISLETAVQNFRQDGHKYRNLIVHPMGELPFFASS